MHIHQLKQNHNFGTIVVRLANSKLQANEKPQIVETEKKIIVYLKVLHFGSEFGPKIFCPNLARARHEPGP